MKYESVWTIVEMKTIAAELLKRTKGRNENDDDKREKYLLSIVIIIHNVDEL